MECSVTRYILWEKDGGDNRCCHGHGCYIMAFIPTSWEAFFEINRRKSHVTKCIHPTLHRFEYVPIHTLNKAKERNCRFYMSNAMYGIYYRLLDSSIVSEYYMEFGQVFFSEKFVLCDLFVDPTLINVDEDGVNREVEYVENELWGRKKGK